MSVDRGGQAIEHLVQYIDLETLRADSVTPLAHNWVVFYRAGATYVAGCL